MKLSLRLNSKPIKIINQSHSFGRLSETSVICLSDRTNIRKQEWLSPNGLIWYICGLKTEKGTGARINGVRPSKDLSSAVGQYGTVLQAEVYALLKCVLKITREPIKTDSQTALGDRKNFKFKSKLLGLARFSTASAHSRTSGEAILAEQVALRPAWL